MTDVQRMFILITSKLSESDKTDGRIRSTSACEYPD